MMPLTVTKWDFLAWTCLVLLLVIGLPLFVCMPIWCDGVLYDLSARNVLRGGVHYREVFETNLPGTVWIHAGIRSLLGWRSEALRLVDFAIVSAIVWLLVRWLKPLGVSTTGQVWTAVALYGFYFSTTVSSHCQRDGWMLLPALIALYLRRRQLADLTGTDGSWHRVALRAAWEGIWWGTAFWIKPFVAVPALACWAFTGVLVWRAPAHGKCLLIIDLTGLLAGGLMAGALGIVWLVQSGSWPYFWDIFLNWNPEYMSWSIRELPRRTAMTLSRFPPWSGLHFVAVPVAAVAVWRALTAGKPSNPVPGHAQLAAFYLGWLLQAAYWQKGFDYQLIPAVWLAIAVLAGQRWPLERSLVRGMALASAAAVILGALYFARLRLVGHLTRVESKYVLYLALPALLALLLFLVLRGWTTARWLLVGGFIFCIVALHPLSRPGRTALWLRCLREGSTTELRDRLTLSDGESATGWADLERVRAFLESQGERDSEVTCFNNSTLPLYLEMDLEPSTRFLLIDTMLFFLPTRQEVVRRELQTSRQRYVVSDLWAVGLSPEQAVAEQPGRPLALPPDFPQREVELFPWSEPVIFRFGRYLVHKVTGPVGKLMPEKPGEAP